MDSRGDSKGDSKWIKLTAIADFREGSAKAFKLPNGEEVALFYYGGKFFALENACPHMGGPLCEGDVEERHVTCPWHGWQFDLETGTCLSGLGEDAKSYHLCIDGPDLFLEMED